MAHRLRVVRTVAALRRAIQQWRERGERIALVPTMGALHAGHLALVRAARRRARRVVVSIFVNPAQFAPHEDFASYPRSPDSDLAALAEMQVDLVWAPPVAVMYPPGFATRVVPEGPATAGLEDKFRPHFFGGVTTVVGKLLIQCAPDYAMFGEKDYQQLKVVTRLATDLDLPAKIVGVPTVREQDGLALSSRNAYLSASERAAAPALYRVLKDCAGRIAHIARADGRERPYIAHVEHQGVDARLGGLCRDRPYGELLARVLDEGGAAIERAGFTLDYLEARHADTLLPVASVKDGPIRLLVAARIGKTRLIDNIAV
jgi:pantoate--beta-alanine ligase